MTKKDYVLIADSLHDNYPYMQGLDKIDMWEKICRSLAESFGYHNIRFDSNKFLKACGIEN